MLEKSKIISILDSVLNQTSKKRKGGDQLVYQCVKCNHYKKKLEISLDEKQFGIFHCWVCGFSGNLYNLLKFCNAPQSYYDQIKALTSHIKKHHVASEKTYGELILPPEFIPLAIASSKCPEYRNALAYVKKRGVLIEDILRYNIGYCKDGEYANHIVVPSYDCNGQLNFFIGRRYYDVEGSIPYKKPNAPMNTIVGFELFINWAEPLNFVEGVFDAFAVRNNAVPLFGKYPSPTLRERMIINGTKQVNMILDDDAMKDAIKNCKMMWELGIEVKLVKLKGKDPSKIGFEKTQEFISNAKPFEFDDLLAHSLQL